MTNYVYIATSLDGYIAAPDNGLDWLNDIPPLENTDYGFAEFMNMIDGIIMGRKTFEVVHSFGSWPYTKPVFVLSNRLPELPPLGDHQVEIVSGSLPQILEQLAQRGFQDLYIDGGLTVQSFLREDLIDTMIITRVPLLLGGGVLLFGELPSPLAFELTSTSTYDNGLTTSTYVRTR